MSQNLTTESSGIDSLDQDKRLVVAGYAHFWDNVKFLKGYEKPFCSRVDAQPYLERAAELVCWIRKEHKVQWEKFGIVGSAVDYLSSCHHAPKENPEAFVRALVHASLRDGHNKYPCDWTVEQVDHLIANFGGAWPESYHIQDSTGTLADIGDVLSTEMMRLQQDMNVLLDRIAKCPHASKSLATKQKIPFVRVQTYLETARMTIESLLNTVSVFDDCKDDTVTSTDTPADDMFPLFPLQKHTEEHTARAQTTDDTLQEPQTQPQEPQTQPQEPQTQPQEPQTQPQEPQTQPQEPQTQPQEPQTQPQEPQTQPQEPQTQPQEPQTQPKQQTSRPADVPSKPVVEEGVVRVSKVGAHVQHIGERIKKLAEVVPQALENPTSMNAETVRKLKGTCKSFSESLMQDLVSLDQMPIPDDEEVATRARQLRKLQVKEIQKLLDVVDSVEHKLGEIQTHIDAERQAQKQTNSNTQVPNQNTQAAQPTPVETSKPQQAAAPTQQAAAPTQQAAAPAQQSQPLNTSAQVQQAVAHKPVTGTDLLLSENAYASLWPQLRLEPHFNVSETQDAFVLTSMIPGMRMEDIKIEVTDQNNIVIQGCRLPSSSEVKMLRGQLKNRIRAQAFNSLSPPQEAELILRLAVGSFGTFVQKFQLPRNVDNNAIDAEYRGGVLTVTLPKVHFHPQPRSARMHPQVFDTPFGQHFTNSEFPQFFSNRDLFW